MKTVDLKLNYQCHLEQKCKAAKAFVKYIIYIYGIYIYIYIFLIVIYLAALFKTV